MGLKILFDYPLKTLEKLLKKKKYDKFLIELNSLTNYPRCLPQSYDRYKDITPYDESVRIKYKLDSYINASFVTVNNDFYIACQKPTINYNPIFIDFLNKCDAKYLICLEKDVCYLKNYKKISCKIIEENGIELLRDCEYQLDNKIIRTLICSNWVDHGVLEKSLMEKLWQYLSIIPKNELKIIHCKAGVGRTGTLIMFRALKEMESITHKSFIEMLILLRKQRTKMVYSTAQIQFLAEYFLTEE